MSDWSIDQAKEFYNVKRWSDGFFDIDENGHLLVYPNGERDRTGIDLVQLTEKLREEGFCLPILVRFNDILYQRFSHLRRAFTRAIAEYDYQGAYTSVYPIKVNQQRHVVEQIVSYRTKNNYVGLEAGSKPELIAVLALSTEKDSVVICNGYKDSEYIKLALIGQRLGHRVYIILEKISELDVVLKEAREMKIRPLLGIRVRLASMGAGKWQHTGGEKAKFGFSALQVLQVIEKLKAADALDTLQLIHFHLGSQVANISDIQRGMRECARYYAELHALGVNIKTVDVGGGLAVDYEGTRSRSYFSMNYSIQEYANNIVYTLSEVCKAHDLPHPEIITESGRAMVAHHAMLIVNVIEVEQAVPKEELVPASPDETQVVQELWYGYKTISERSAIEIYHDACHWMAEAHSMYNLGIISLIERARAEQIYLATCYRVKDFLKHSVRSHREIIDELNEKLADKVFCNFSLFQSLPDAWAIDQTFPIMPLSGLDEKPTARGVLQDITCDSDGRVDTYVDNDGVETTLPMVPFKNDAPYFLGIFLVGAYQEILGDMHNLFGDTYSVHVELDDEAEAGYRLEYPLHGDRVESVLRYVQFEAKDLIAAYQQQFDRADLPTELANEYLEVLKEGLQGYTYLED